MVYLKSKRSQEDPTKLTLEFLPAQMNDKTGAFFPTNEKVIASDRFALDSFPEGTIFGTVVCRQIRGVYTTSTLLPFDSSFPSGYKGLLPTVAELAAFNSYMESIEDDEDDIFKLAEKQKKETANQTFLERLLADHPCPTIEKCGYYIKPDDYKVIARNIFRGVNTVLTGPAGTGKTEILLMLCQMFGFPCHVYHMGAMQDPVAQLLGSHRIGQDGKSVFEYARFVDEIQQPGFILFDELSRAPSVAHNILYPVLDNQRMLTVDGAGTNEKRVFKVHPDCHFLATANVGEEYTGTFELDKAIKERFMFVEMGFIPHEEEVKLLMNRTNIKRTDADNIVNTATTIRSAYFKDDLKTAVSTRETLRAAAMVADGFTTLMAMTYCFLPLFEGNADECGTERNTVKTMFCTR